MDDGKGREFEILKYKFYMILNMEIGQDERTYTGQDIFDNIKKLAELIMSTNRSKLTIDLKKVKNGSYVEKMLEFVLLNTDLYIMVLLNEVEEDYKMTSKSKKNEVIILKPNEGVQYSDIINNIKTVETGSIKINIKR